MMRSTCFTLALCLLAGCSPTPAPKQSTESPTIEKTKQASTLLGPHGILSTTVERTPGKPAYLVVKARLTPGNEIAKSNVMKVLFNGTRLQLDRLVGVPANITKAFGPPSWVGQEPRCNEMTGGWTVVQDDDWTPLNPEHFAFGNLRGMATNCPHTLFFDVSNLVRRGDNTIEIRNLTPPRGNLNFPQKQLEVARLEIVDDYRNDALLVMTELKRRQAAALPPWGTHRDNPEVLVRRYHALRDRVPDWASGHLRRAAVFCDAQGKTDRAATLYHEYLQVFPDGVDFEEMAARLTILLCRIGKLEEAARLAGQLKRSRPRSAWADVAGSWVALSQGRPQRSLRPVLRLPKTGIAPVLDGKLDDECWQRAATATVAPTGVVPGTPATVKVTWDDDNLYVAWRLETAGRARMPGGFKKKDDPVWRFEAAEAFLCPGATFWTYYELDFGPNGARYDGRNRFYYIVDSAWNPSWKTETRVNETNWTAESVIPFKQLGVSTPKVGEFWSGNFARCGYVLGGATGPDRDFYGSWVKLPKPHFHLPQYHGFLLFVQ